MRRIAVLIHCLAENKTENTDDIVISTISKHLHIVISKEDIDRYHRFGKFDLAKTKPRPVRVKFSRYNICDKVFTHKQKLKGKEISIFKSLSKLYLLELDEARDQHSFGDVWSNDGKIKVFYD